MMKLVLLVTAVLVTGGTDGRLATNGKSLTFNGQNVFLSGVNFAWNSYGYDFGNNQYNANSKTIFQNWVNQISASGGNSVRIWLHVEGTNTPTFDVNGFVTSLDTSGTMVAEMKDFLDFCQSKNVIVIFVLWNGAVMNNQKVIDLFWDDSKMQSYINNALKPMVTGLGNHPALGAWEIMNEPEGSVRNNVADANPCFDTTPLVNTGAGWTGKSIPMKNFLRGINWQTAAIKEANPTSLVTVGSWSQHPQTDSYADSRNYYTNNCLVAAGDKAAGVLDFYQMHTYAYQNQWEGSAPFKVQASSYNLDKPLIIGEFASSCSAGESVQQLYQYAYNNGYQGVWSWQYNAGGECSDSAATQDAGMNALKGQNGNGGLVNFPVN